jgi:hypothetical protein
MRIIALIVAVVVVSITFCNVVGAKKGNGQLIGLVKKEIEAVNEMTPVIPEGRVFFWRPQKVGSSTILSLLLSFSFRYNVMTRRKGIANGFCLKVGECIQKGLVAPVNATKARKDKMIPYTEKELIKLDTKKEQLLETAKYQVVTGHHICNLPSFAMYAGMTCGYENKNSRNNIMLKIGRATNQLKEVFVVRDPLSRAISIYYFWGELYRMKYVKQQNSLERPKTKEADNNPYLTRKLASTDGKVYRLGELDMEETEIVGKLFKYHGNETTPPPNDIAMSFAKNLPLKRGMPGPSYTWSLFSNEVKDALAVIASNRMVSVVTERLDESLVVASHYLNWTLADMVVASHRKAQSEHPKHSAWPADAVAEIKRKLIVKGEYAVYNASVAKLDSRIAALKARNIDFDGELALLRSLKERIAKVGMRK